MSEIILTNGVLIASDSKEMHGIDTSNILAKGGQNLNGQNYTFQQEGIIFFKRGNANLIVDDYDITNGNRIPKGSCTLFCKKGTIIKETQHYSYGDDYTYFGVK